ncbi:MAG: TIGR03960 family B12-binding radical SAM protein, partial [Clostridia bacterium]|nr:TIGR03960 family B12-binding radical SAM protein [Clostridia bacterium]
NAPKTVKRRVVKDFENVFSSTKLIVPLVEVVHDRIMLEIFRGCTRGCRFCQAGFLYRPIRERSVDKLVQLARASADATGYDEISLTSLSSGDYSQLEELIKRLSCEFENEHMDISLPSLRIDSFNPDFVSTQMRKSSLTFAPEAGSQRMRNIINKNVSEEDLLRTVRGAYEAGYKAIKLYFMIGLPFETMDDIKGIYELAKKCSDVFREVNGNNKNMRITVSTSVFIPKPFTPFQWIRQDNEESVKEKQRYLSDLIRTLRGVEYKYHDSTASKLEVACARGGREMCNVLYSAWKNGAKLDAWNEHFRFDVWEKAFEENGISMEEMAQREYDVDDVLPWDTVDVGVTKAYYKRELKRAMNEEVTPDCRNGCTGCGMMALCKKEAEG